MILVGVEEGQKAKKERHPRLLVSLSFSSSDGGGFDHVESRKYERSTSYKYKFITFIFYHEKAVSCECEVILRRVHYRIPVPVYSVFQFQYSRPTVTG